MINEKKTTHEEHELSEHPYYIARIQRGIIPQKIDGLEHNIHIIGS